ncbi:hypothetical protein N0457_33445, partial [Pseudomonas aeruginosa]|nr:hypothetical protein [Pseudomonas aeruginosa]
ICFIGKLGGWSPGILPKSGSLFQDFPRSQFSNVIPLAIYFCVFFPVFSAFAKKSKYIMSSPVSDRG